MNKQILIGILFLSMILMLSNLSLAETTQVEDTVIEYVSYREVVVGDPGIVYQMKLVNAGTREKDYTIVPDTEVIREIGTYRIDPSEKVVLQPGEEKIVYFYLAVEKPMTGRTEIPVEIRTGLAETKINLVARAIGPLGTGSEGRAKAILVAFIKIILIILLVIIIIIALVFTFRKSRKKKEEDQEFEPDFDEDIETYY